MSGLNGAATSPFNQSVKEKCMETVVLIETLIGVILATVLGLFTRKDLIARYPIYPLPSWNGGDEDDGGVSSGPDDV
jgi:hypothetical protein